MPFYPQTLNRYAYCYNNPIVIRDLDGHAGTGYWSTAWSNTKSAVSRAWGHVKSFAIRSWGHVRSAAGRAWTGVKNAARSVVKALGGGGGGDRSIASSSNTSRIDTPLISAPLSERPTTLWAYWDYSQTTGHLNYVDDQTGATTSIGTGYSGFGPGLNNSDMQDVSRVGPIPQGTWTIGPQQNNTTGLGHNLPASMRLTPQTGTNTDRKGFMIHGDNGRGNQSASEGCIILNRNIRNQIGNSGDNVLRVTP